MKRRRGSILVSVLTLLSVLGALSPIVSMWFGIFRTEQFIHDRAKQVCLRDNYEPAGRLLAEYCQSGPEIVPKDMFDCTWLPEPVRKFDPHWVQMSADGAHVEMGGGFHHFGYELVRDQEKSSAAANVWRLSFCDEGENNKELFTFQTDPKQHITPEQLVRDVWAAYDAKIAKAPDDAEELYQKKIRFLLQFDPGMARKAARQMLTAYPQYWWAQMLVSFIDYSQGHQQQAEQAIEKWASAQPGYSRYLYAERFYEMIDKPQSAADAAQKAVALPMAEMRDDRFNGTFLGYSAALYLHNHRQYAPALALCDKLMKGGEGYAQPALKALRASIVAGQAGHHKEVAPHEDVGVFDPFNEMDLKALVSGAP